MPRYSINGAVAADKHLGEVEAESATAALVKAWAELDTGSPNICHQCSREVEIGEVYKIIATNLADDDDTAEQEG